MIPEFSVCNCKDTYHDIGIYKNSQSGVVNTSRDNPTSILFEYWIDHWDSKWEVREPTKLLIPGGLI